ncbi:ankyrin, partial [Lichtheimia hyalospora FSU 10163]
TIWEATKEGDVSLVVRALEMAGDNANTLVNTRDPDTQSTLLYLAITHNKDPVPLLKVLLAYGADPTLPNVYSVQAIHALAVHCNHHSILEALQLLLDNEADVNARDGDDWTPLHYVARFVRNESTLLPALRLLIQRGAQVNATDASHKSPLFALVANGDHAASLDWLIHRAGANIGLQAQFLDPRARNTFLGTALLQAAKYARVGCLQVLARAHMVHLKESVSRNECEQAVQWILDNKR